MRVFGSLFYAHIQQKGGDKFLDRSRRCIFVGYPVGKKAWRLFDIEANTYLVSRDVIFYEEEFPYANQITTPTASNYQFPQIFDEELDPSVEEQQLDATQQLESSMPTCDTLPPNEAITSNSNDVPIPVEQSNITTEPPPGPTSTNVPVEAPTGRGQWNRKPPLKLQDYVTNMAYIISENDRSRSTSPNQGTRYPLYNFLSTDRFSTRHCEFIAAVTGAVEPTSFAQAMKDHWWREAMQLETKALEENQTWPLTTLPPGKRALGCK